jgi:hypothetical protein
MGMEQWWNGDYKGETEEKEGENCRSVTSKALTLTLSFP